MRLNCCPRLKKRNRIETVNDNHPASPAPHTADQAITTKSPDISDSGAVMDTTSMSRAYTIDETCSMACSIDTSSVVTNDEDQPLEIEQIQNLERSQSTSPKIVSETVHETETHCSTEEEDQLDAEESYRKRLSFLDLK